MVKNTALDAAELQALRQEITSHITLSTTLMALELAAVGSSLSLVDKSTHILAVNEPVGRHLGLYNRVIGLVCHCAWTARRPGLPRPHPQTLHRNSTSAR